MAELCITISHFIFCSVNVLWYSYVSHDNTTLHDNINLCHILYISYGALVSI